MHNPSDNPGTAAPVCHLLRFHLPFCLLTLMLLSCLAVPSMAAVHTVNPGGSISQAVTDAAEWDTIVLNPGLYEVAVIAVNKNLTFRANASAGGTAENTIVSSENNNPIFYMGNPKTVVVHNLTMQNGRYSNGAAIFYNNGGNLTVISSRFVNCSASDNGGALRMYGGSLTVIGSTFVDCSATQRGGAIEAALSTVTIDSSTFSNCTSGGGYGGAIYGWGSTTMTITSSVFSDCPGDYGSAINMYQGPLSVESSDFINCTPSLYGGVISIGQGSGSVHFCRFSSGTNRMIDAGTGTINASDNWWGSNDDPSALVGSGATAPTWLLLNVTAIPSAITTGQTSLIRVNITNNSAGIDTTSGGIFVPDGIPATFAVTSGTGNVVPQDGNITSGANTTTFTAGGTGTSTVTATVDGQTVQTAIIISPPSVVTLNPGDSIQENISAVQNGGTIILNPGEYAPTTQIQVSKNITIRANTTAGGNPENTVVDGLVCDNGIFVVNDGVDFTVDNLTLQNGARMFIGGAISSSYSSSPGSLTVTSSVFRNCTAENGGAIGISAPERSTSITASAFFDCSAKSTSGAMGGAINSGEKNFTVTSSTFSRCSADTEGGAILTTSTSVITSTSFSDCTSGSGGAVATSSNTIRIHFCRFDNVTSLSHQSDALYFWYGDANVTGNWWGTNSEPSTATTISMYGGTLVYNPWLVLNITAAPSTISQSETAAIRLNLTRLSNGLDTASGGVFVPAGIPAAFAVTSGTGSLTPLAGNISSGANTTTFTPAGPGTSTISAMVDGEMVSTGIVVTAPVTPDTIGVFRPSETKFILKNGTDTINITFGKSTDTGVSGDWNGDGISEIGVHRAAVQKFVLKNGSESTIVKWGLTTDTGVAGDWNGDGMGDIGVFRSSLQKFVVKNGTVKTIIKWGQTTDKPVTGDWNGDGLWDIGVFRPSTHQFVLKNGTEKTMITFGQSTDLPVAWDWNGDGLWDVGVYRPSTGEFLLKDGEETITIAYGDSTDLPIAGKWR